MIPVYSPSTESEAAVISAMLEANNIPFYIRGGAFSKLYPWVQIKDYNTQTFMIPNECFEDARELLSEFINPSIQEQSDLKQWSLLRALRVLFELICFGWIVTGKRWTKNENDN